VLKQYLTDGARQRLNAVAMSKPEFGDKVKQQVAALAQSGRIQGQIDEDQMRATPERNSNPTSRASTFGGDRWKPRCCTAGETPRSPPTCSTGSTTCAASPAASGSRTTGSTPSARPRSFPFERVELDRGVVAEEAIQTMIDDGYPERIQRVHEHALETIASRDADAIADGTRRDDRVPTVSRAQSAEPGGSPRRRLHLPAFGVRSPRRRPPRRGDVRRPAGPSEEVPKADYEDELRTLIADEHGEETVSEVFPDHNQTYVHGRND